MKIIKSASTSRVYERLRNNDIQVAIISPYRGEYNNKENKERMTHLKADVRKLGYGFNQLVSRWVENGESFDEESLLIPDITFNQAFQLGKKYDQLSILYKDSGMIREPVVW